ncbi:hypothetical protein MtrunA17_Chr1g0192871 [Medicago truncatula]|uniref:Uncharacterized protein n=1 Tax=Medicago truncatula TaxID=3880 RepID=A0A396K346_MEDTR|nr:hypothetical protein MtrunA17_Chr1g0192871 [Medicago truncatula]
MAFITCHPFCAMMYSFGLSFMHALPKRERTKEIYFITQRDLLLFMNTLIIILGRWI